MAAEYSYNALQEVALNSPVVLSATIPCTCGYVYHEDDTGIFILRGITNNCFATYQITFNGNIALPADGTLAPIAVALTVNGEVRPISKAIYSPADLAEFGNVTSTAIIQIPRGCCFSVAVEAVAANTTDTPAPAIEVENANLVINRIA